MAHGAIGVTFDDLVSYYSLMDNDRLAERLLALGETYIADLIDPEHREDCILAILYAIRHNGGINKPARASEVQIDTRRIPWEDNR